MRKTLLSIFIILNILSMNAQTKDSLTLKKAPLGGYILYNSSGQRITFNKVIELSKSNEEARMYFQKAEANLSFGSILGFVGGALLGYQLGGAIVTGQVKNPAYAIAGIGVIGFSIPFGMWANKNLRKGVELYNKPLRVMPSDTTLRSSR